MRDGARKWNGPFCGLEFIRLRRKRSYFIFCRTSPPEMVISSARTITCAAACLSRQRGEAALRSVHGVETGTSHRRRGASGA